MLVERKAAITTWQKSWHVTSAGKTCVNCWEIAEIMESIKIIIIIDVLRTVCFPIITCFSVVYNALFERS